MLMKPSELLKSTYIPIGLLIQVSVSLETLICWQQCFSQACFQGKNPLKNANTFPPWKLAAGRISKSHTLLLEYKKKVSWRQISQNQSCCWGCAPDPAWKSILQRTSAPRGVHPPTAIILPLPFPFLPFPFLSSLFSFPLLFLLLSPRPSFPMGKRPKSPKNQNNPIFSEDKKGLRKFANKAGEIQGTTNISKF